MRLVVYVDGRVCGIIHYEALEFINNLDYKGDIPKLLSPSNDVNYTSTPNDVLQFLYHITGASSFIDMETYLKKNKEITKDRIMCLVG